MPPPLNLSCPITGALRHRDILSQMLHRSGAALCACRKRGSRPKNRRASQMSKLFCLRNQELRSGLRETRKTKCSATIVTAAQWEHWQVRNIDTNACEGHEITQHVKLLRCAAAPVPVCVVFRPLEFGHHRMRDQRSDVRLVALLRTFSLSFVVMGVLQGNASCEPPY